MRGAVAGLLAIGMMSGWGERMQRDCPEDCAHSPHASSSSRSDGPDAAYKLAHEQPSTKEGDVARRRYLQQALDGFRLRGDHQAASGAAQYLARMALDENDFEKALELAGTADVYAEQIPIQRARTRALFAEIYDSLGMASAAQRDFMEAEELSAGAPDEAANILLKHGCFLLDQRKPEQIERALRFFKEARSAVVRSQKQGRGDRVQRDQFAIALNMADALSQLGRLEEAEAELALLDNNELTLAQVEYRWLVTGYIAARRGDVAAAERAFDAADASHEMDDYRWQMALELARALNVSGDLKRAETLLRRAVGIVDELRRSAAQLDLRPWILARRNDAHRQLFELLVEQGRALEALAIAEAMSSQTWLDAAIDVRLADETNQREALRAARLRTKLAGGAWPAAPGSVAAPPATHEVLLYVDLGDRIWRAHLRNGTVTFQELPADTGQRLTALAQDLENATYRQAAGLALLPNDLSAGGDPLYIIAYGAMADVPFAALETGGKFLIQSRDVARLPGLAALRCRPRTWSQEAIVLGDARNNLPFAAAEARRLASSLATKPYLREAATEEALLRAKNARLLHVATHGVEGIDGRVLQLADRDVPAAMILEKGVAPRLAVLSGCATAASDAPESWNGFPSALLAAGSQYVIATLQSIEDRAAARVVSAFYAQPEGSPVAQLAAAQRSLLGDLPVRDWSAFAAWGADDCEAHLAQPDERPLPREASLSAP